MDLNELKEYKDKIHYIDKKVENNLSVLEYFFVNSEIICKRITNTSNKKALYGIAYLDNSIDINLLNRDVLKPIRNHVSKGSAQAIVISELEDSIGNISEVCNLDEAMDFLVQGFVLFFAESYEKAWMIELKGFPKRPAKDPENEGQARGPRIGFTEILGENTALIRRLIKSSELKFKTFVIGTKSKTMIQLVYIETLIEQNVLKEIEKRLKSIKTDVIVGTGQFNEFITDHPSSPFPQTLRTERPDSAAANLSEGRAVILVDGQPDAIIIPAPMTVFFQTLDEYNTPWIFGSLLRLIRWVSFIIASSLPGFYIAIISLNHEILPIGFLVIIAESRSRVPFPPLIEAFLMEITIEILREAGIRLPGPLGQTIGIVGAIVIGDAAVQAGLASNIMVIVVAVTTIATFVLPTFEFGLTLRFIRFPLMILGYFFGFVGLLLGLAFMIAHLCIIETVGIPYLTSISPFRTRDMQDTFLRLPPFLMTKRPASARDSKRIVNNRRKK
ncbi:MAG: hypothetical protein APF76_08990 [Desulfitibacter sp. BRH_c19]|nr:MAG: hypothetical protein APF76_08990 [Desulfitibacter sp. BRH_c19]